MVNQSDETTPRNDIASATPLDDESLLIVWHKYRTIDFEKCDIVAKRSYDGGIIWQDEQRLVACNPLDNNVQAPALCKLRNGFCSFSSVIMPVVKEY